MSSPNVSLSRDLLNDYIYRALAKIDVSLFTPEDLNEARKILLEMSQYIIQATIQDAKQSSFPRIGGTRF